MVHWVVSEIVSVKDLEGRIDVLKKFLDTATQLLEFNNFASVMDINLGLTHPSVARLKKTWAGLSADYQAKASELRAIGDLGGNFSGYRTAIKNAQVSCQALNHSSLLFTGLSSTARTYALLRTATPTTSPTIALTIGSLLNGAGNEYGVFSPPRVLRDLRRSQKRGYSFEKVEAIISIVGFSLTTDPARLSELSRECGTFLCFPNQTRARPYKRELCRAPLFL